MCFDGRLKGGGRVADVINATVLIAQKMTALPDSKLCMTGHLIHAVTTRRLFFSVDMWASDAIMLPKRHTAWWAVPSGQRGRRVTFSPCLLMDYY